MERQPIFSVVTPTYNRAHTLPRVYNSLLKQTYRDFEWLIVDDGSTDETEQLVHRWQTENRVAALRYCRSPVNEGITAARNRGVREARGQIIVFHDSDDACVSETLERFKAHLDSIAEEERDAFVGVTALCNDQHARPIGPDLPKSPLDSNSLEMSFRYKYRREKWGAHRADVLRQYPVPATRGAFLGGAWYNIARRYRTRYVNDRLRIYYVGEPGRREQSVHAPIRDRAEGEIFSQQYLLNCTIDWFRSDPRYFLMVAVHHARFCFHGGRGLARQIMELDAPLPRVLGLVALPLGLAVCALDRVRGL